MKPDNERDRGTFPTESWWCDKSREQLHDAVEREAPRMRHSKSGNSPYLEGPGVLIEVKRGGFNRGRS